MSSVAAAIVLLAGCQTMSVQPVYDGRTQVFEQALVGTWSSEPVAEGSPEAVVVVAAAEGRGYKATLTDEEGGTTDLAAALARLDGHLFLDVTLESLPEGMTDVEKFHIARLHSFFRVDALDGQHLEMSSLNETWLKALLAGNPAAIAHTVIDHDVVLTAETADLQRFLTRYADDPEAWESNGTLYRLAAGPALH